MTPRDVYLSKTALRILEAAGIQGVGREAWMEQVGITAQMPLTTAEQAALIDRLETPGCNPTATPSATSCATSSPAPATLPWGRCD